MSGRISRLALLALLGGLAACGSAPASVDGGEPIAHFNPSKDPYWQDPKWDKTLVDAVQSAVRDPVEPSDTSAPGLHATVKFIYAAGTIEYPEIVTSTGDASMDKLMLHQIASVQAPQATGLQSDVAHEFVLDLDMPTPYEAFQQSIYAAIDYQKIYPKDALISVATGNTVVEFEYLDGKANSISMTASSGSKELDKSSLVAVTRAVMPLVPAPYAGKSMHMQVLFCYTMATALNGPKFTTKNKCPMDKGVIVVQGTLFRTSGMRGG
jgi:hypothetical protein